MKVIIISGRSGSGKTSALHVLEDLGFYCVDNLPTGLIPQLAKQIADDARETPDTGLAAPKHVAVGVDARNAPKQLAAFKDVLQEMSEAKINYQIVYLDADDKTLLKRFSETRRKHPISTQTVSLAEAITMEAQILDPIAMTADLTIDTSSLSLHQLRDLIKKRVGENDEEGMALLFQSFGFKHGIPVDADLVFDVRCLPNPYWKRSLRSLTGMDKDVIEFLEQQEPVAEMLKDVAGYLDRWLPSFQANNRSYMTVAIGCTGGQHRSVYIAQNLSRTFEKKFSNVQVRHRELS